MDRKSQQYKEWHKVYMRRWRAIDKLKDNSSQKQYRKKHKREIYLYGIKWKKEHPDNVRTHFKKWIDKKKQDRTFMLSSRMSASLRGCLKQNKNRRHWENIVGYTVQQLKGHLESKFTNKMNWDNHGTYWHIDHKIPKSWFRYNSTRGKQFKTCWGLNNLQPKVAFENLSKCNRYVG